MIISLETQRKLMKKINSKNELKEEIYEIYDLLFRKKIEISIGSGESETRVTLKTLLDEIIEDYDICFYVFDNLTKRTTRARDNAIIKVEEALKDSVSMLLIDCKYSDIQHLDYNE